MSQSLSSIRYVSTNKVLFCPTVERFVDFKLQTYMFMLFISSDDNWLKAFPSLFSGCSRNEKNCSEEKAGNNTEKKYGAKATRESEVSVCTQYAQCC